MYHAYARTDDHSYADSNCNCHTGPHSHGNQGHDQYGYLTAYRNSYRHIDAGDDIYPDEHSYTYADAYCHECAADQDQHTFCDGDSLPYPTGSRWMSITKI